SASVSTCHPAASASSTCLWPSSRKSPHSSRYFFCASDFSRLTAGLAALVIGFGEGAIVLCAGGRCKKHIPVFALQSSLSVSCGGLREPYAPRAVSYGCIPKRRRRPLTAPRIKEFVEVSKANKHRLPANIFVTDEADPEKAIPAMLDAIMNKQAVAAVW